MKFTLGQAAKEAGVSKTAISNAIKKGRLSAEKSESGSYSIDASELFRVYPPKPVNKGAIVTEVNPEVDGVSGVNEQVLSVQLTANKELLEEKEKQIQRLLDEKEKLEERLTESSEQQKRLTLLLTDQSQVKDERVGDQDKKLDELVKANEILRKQNRRFLYELKAQQELSLWERLFGKKEKKDSVSKTG
jgi:hypothetical protein